MVQQQGGGGGGKGTGKKDGEIYHGAPAYGIGFGYGQAIPTKEQAAAALAAYNAKNGVAPAKPYVPGPPVYNESYASKTPTPPPASAEPSIMDSLLDPGAMASREFDPQFQLLNKLQQQAEARYGKAGRDVSGMYAQLADEFRGQEAGINKQYGAAGAALKGQLASATGALSADMAKSRDEITKRAARLGVADVVPQLSNESAAEQNQYSGLLQAISQNYQGANTANQQADVSYNRNTAGTTDLMGVDARQNFEAMLQNALNEYGNKRLELQGQQMGAENKYALENQGMMNAQEKARADAAAEAARLKQQWNIAQLQYGPKAAEAKEPDYNKLPSDIALSTMAQKLYGTPDSQQNAMRAILDTFQRGAKSQGYKRNWTNVNDFLDALRYRNQGATDWDKLAALGSLYFSKQSGGGNKSFGYDQYGTNAKSNAYSLLSSMTRTPEDIRSLALSPTHMGGGSIFGGAKDKAKSLGMGALDLMFRLNYASANSAKELFSGKNSRDLSGLIGVPGAA